MHTHINRRKFLFTEKQLHRLYTSRFWNDFELQKNLFSFRFRTCKNLSLLFFSLFFSTRRTKKFSWKEQRLLMYRHSQ